MAIRTVGFMSYSLIEIGGCNSGGAAFPDIDVIDYSDCLRHPPVWQALIESMVSKLTVIGDNSIRIAVIRYLAEIYVESSNVSRLHMKELLQVIEKLSTTQALGFFEPSEILKMIKTEILPPQRKYFTIK